MITDWRKHMIDKSADQCLEGTAFILSLLDTLKPKVYVETGCAHLATFELYHSLLPEDGLAIGIDLRAYEPWKTYEQIASTNKYSAFSLYSNGLQNLETTRRTMTDLLNRSIDFLFIEGDHSEKGVQLDWNILGPKVRSGGLVVLHDYDPSAFKRGVRDGQGAAILCDSLAKQGYDIKSIKNTKIGTAYFYKP